MLSCADEQEAKQLAKDITERTWGEPMIAVHLKRGEWVVIRESEQDLYAIQEKE